MDIIYDGGCLDWVKLRIPLATLNVFVNAIFLFTVLVLVLKDLWMEESMEGLTGPYLNYF